MRTFRNSDTPAAQHPPYIFRLRGYTRAGLKFVIQQHSCMGHLCGYVRLPSTHPWYRRAKAKRLVRMHWTGRKFRCQRLGYMRLPVSVHGGLSFFGRIAGENGWWLGFDCAHLGDLVPRMRIYPGEVEVFRDEAYVRSECEWLAQQIKEGEQG